MGILSPRGEGDVRNCKAHKLAKYIPSFKVSPQAIKVTFSSPLGERMPIGQVRGYHPPKRGRVGMEGTKLLIILLTTKFQREKIKKYFSFSYFSEYY